MFQSYNMGFHNVYSATADYFAYSLYSIIVYRTIIRPQVNIYCYIMICHEIPKLEFSSNLEFSNHVTSNNLFIHSFLYEMFKSFSFKILEIIMYLFFITRLHAYTHDLYYKYKNLIPALFAYRKNLKEKYTRLCDVFLYWRATFLCVE